MSRHVDDHDATNAYQSLAESVGPRRPALGLRHRRRGRRQPRSPRRSRTASTPPTSPQYCLMLGDDALILAPAAGGVGHATPRSWRRRSRWPTSPSTCSARPGCCWHGPAHVDRRRDRDEDALAYLRAEPEFRNVALAELPDELDFARAVARLLVFSTWRLALLHRLLDSARPGARGGRRQGRQGARLPPRLRRPLGAAARRRHGGVAPADAGRARRRLAATSTSCSAPRTSSAGSPRPEWRSTRRRPRDGGRRACSTRCSAAATLARPQVAPAGTIGGRGGRQGLHTEHLGPAARRAAEPGPPAPRSDLVTAAPHPTPVRARGRGARSPTRRCRCSPSTTSASSAASRSTATRVTVTITPTYSGCPALVEMRADLRAALARAGYRHGRGPHRARPRRGAPTGSPNAGRRTLAEHGIAPPVASGRAVRARAADPDRRRRRPSAARAAARPPPRSSPGSARRPAPPCAGARPAASRSST